MPVIHPRHNFPLENSLQLAQVQNHSSNRVRLPSHSNFQSVVMPMSMRIIAFPKHPPIFFRRPSWIVIPMRSRKLDFACQQNHRSPFTESRQALPPKSPDPSIPLSQQHKPDTKPTAHPHTTPPPAHSKG